MKYFPLNAKAPVQEPFRRSVGLVLCSKCTAGVAQHTPEQAHYRRYRGHVGKTEKKQSFSAQKQGLPQ